MLESDSSGVVLGLFGRLVKIRSGERLVVNGNGCLKARVVVKALFGCCVYWQVPHSLVA